MVAGHKINVPQINSFPICQTSTFKSVREQKELIHDSNKNYKMPKNKSNKLWINGAERLKNTQDYKH